jgi:signal transduction histidine kinase
VSESGPAARPYVAQHGSTYLPRIRSTSVALLMMALGFMAFLLTVYASRKSLDEVFHHAEQRVEAMETKLLIQQVSTLLMHADLNQRALASSGPEEVAESYRQTLLKLQEAHSQLASRLLGLPDSGHAQVLNSMMERHAAYSRLALDRLRQSGEALAGDTDSAREARLLRASMQAELSQLATEQTQAVASVEQHIALLNNVLAVLGVLFIASAGWRHLGERRRRDRAEAELRRVNATLEHQVSQRTTQVQFALRQIQSFAIELDRSIEGERKRIARELHDQFGQIATAIRMVVVGLRKTEPPVAEPVVNELLQMVDEAIGIARRISAALRPPLLDDLGLAAAVEHFASGVERQSGMQVSCHVSDDGVLSPNQANQLFRILQEATTNVLRHARATELRIEAAVNDGIYRLEVSDNGVGPGNIRPDASGIRNMRERAQLIDGLLQFGPGDDAGTCVRVHVPLTTAMKRSA